MISVLHIPSFSFCPSLFNLFLFPLILPHPSLPSYLYSSLQPFQHAKTILSSRIIQKHASVTDICTPETKTKNKQTNYKTDTGIHSVIVNSLPTPSLEKCLVFGRYAFYACFKKVQTLSLLKVL